MIHRHFEHLIRRTANRFGIDVHRYRPESSAPGCLSIMLKANDVNLILDVGANVGQFARSIREAGFRGRLISFEPLSNAHARLVRASRSDSLWQIAPRVAIGAAEGEVEMQVAGNSVSSSVLTMLQAHLAAAPESACTGMEIVRIARLDVVARSYLRPDSVIFVKIDTQGYEDRVLDGAAGILDAVSGLQLELSLVPLYEDQQLFDALVDRLRILGFSIWGVFPGIHDRHSGRMLQVDAVFFRD